MKRSVKNCFAGIFAVASMLVAAGCQTTYGTRQQWPENAPVSGAAKYARSLDRTSSPYYPRLDFYNGGFSPTLKLLREFRTCQQTTEYTCGAAAVWMVLNYWGAARKTERELAEEMDIRPETNPKGDSFGCPQSAIEQAFQNRGIAIQPWKQFKDGREFSVFLKNRIASCAPVLVEWIAWGGHWTVIIGYDDMGTAETADDVLIMADPYDTTDHWQDGYTVVSLERFFYEWLDAGVLSRGITRQHYVAPIPR